MRFAPLCLASAVVLLAGACGGDVTPPRQRPSVGLVLNAFPDVPRPGDGLELTLTATPASGDEVTQFGLRFRGLLTGDDSVFVTDGTTLVYTTVSVPLSAGILAVTGFVQTRNGAYQEQTRTFTISDLAAPTVKLSSLQTSPAVGNFISGSVLVQDDIGLKYTVVRYGGPAPSVDSLDAHGARSVARTLSFTVPSASIAGAVHVDVDAVDLSGNLTTLHLTSADVRDQTPPAVNAVFTGGSGYGRYSQGDTIRFSIAAHDNVALRRVGYAIDGPFAARDSATVTGADYAATVVIPTAGRSGVSQVTLFAIDSVGARVDVAGGRIDVGTTSGPATGSVVLSNASGITDIAYDAKRGVLLFAQPTANMVSVVSLPGLTELAPVRVINGPSGLDLSLGGDSLIVARYGEPSLAVVNLLTAVQTAIPLASPAAGATSVRVMANNHAIVAETFSGVVVSKQVVELDIGSGAIVSSATGSGGALFARTPDRRWLFGLPDNGCCPVRGFTYNTVAGSFSDPTSVATQVNPIPVISPDGSRLFVSNVVLNNGLRKLSTVNLSSTYGPIVAAADASVVLVGAPQGIARVQVSDGTVLATYPLGFTPDRLYLLPDGVTLVALHGNTVTVVDVH